MAHADIATGDRRRHKRRARTNGGVHTEGPENSFSRAPSPGPGPGLVLARPPPVPTAEREPASMSGEQRGERGGPSALLSGLPVRDANAFAQRKLDAASFPACALLLPELTSRGSLGPHPSQTNAGHGGANLPRHARPHEPPSRPRRVPASKGFPPTPVDPRPSLPIESSPRRSCRHGDDKHHPAALPAAQGGGARVRGWRPRRSRSPNARLSPSQKQRERQKRAPPAAEAARKTAKLARPTSQ